MIHRRNFLAILAGSIAAPMIVRPGLIMPVRALPEELPDFLASGGLMFAGHCSEVKIGDVLCVNGIWRTVTAVVCGDVVTLA